MGIMIVGIQAFDRGPIEAPAPAPAPGQLLLINHGYPDRGSSLKHLHLHERLWNAVTSA